MRLRRINPFPLQENFFQSAPARETAERSVTADDSMAGDEEQNRVCGTGAADGSRSPRAADLSRDLRVGSRLTMRNFS